MGPVHIEGGQGAGGTCGGDKEAGFFRRALTHPQDGQARTAPTWTLLVHTRVTLNSISHHPCLLSAPA